MRATSASLEGLRRTAKAPGLVLATWLLSLVVAAPLSIFILESIHAFTARSEYHGALLEGFDTGWHAEFKAAHGPVEETLSPGHVGIGAWLTNLDRWWDGRVFLEEPALVITGAVFVLCWLLLLGGVLEAVREGAPRPRLSTVLADGLGFFPRFLRVAAMSGVAYVTVFRFARWLFPRVHETTADLTSEKTVLLYNLAAASLVVVLIVFIRLVSDYAKVSMVVDRRRSAAMAVVQGLRFVVANASGAAGIAIAYGVFMILLFLIYSGLAPGAGDSSSAAILVGFLVSQVFVAAKLALRVAFLSSQLTYYEINAR